MEWYVIVFIISTIIIVGQAILSFVLGDLDLSIDANFDLADAFSFKGLLHFIFGASLVLTVFGNLELLTVIIAIITGSLFMYLLYKLYYFLYQNLEQSLTYVQDIVMADAEVYYWDNESQRGEVFVSLEGRDTTVNIVNTSSEPISLSAGQIIKVSGTRTLVNKV